MRTERRLLREEGAVILLFHTIGIISIYAIESAYDFHNR